MIPDMTLVTSDAALFRMEVSGRIGQQAYPLQQRRVTKVSENVRISRAWDGGACRCGAGIYDPRGESFVWKDPAFSPSGGLPPAAAGMSQCAGFQPQKQPQHLLGITKTVFRIQINRTLQEVNEIRMDAAPQA
ncbi:MAG: hypothetical protein RLZZ436_1829 [Planctomycetota bacterium]